MSERPSFQFYPGDWLSATEIALMTPAEEGAYIRLLCHCWRDPDCSLPDDDYQLSVLSRLGEGWLENGCPLVRGCFVPHPDLDDRLTHPRLLREREKQDAWKVKSAAGGRKSAEVRWGKKGKGGSDLVTTKRQPKGNTSSSSSSSKKQQPRDPTTTEYTPAAEARSMERGRGGDGSGPPVCDCPRCGEPMWRTSNGQWAGHLNRSSQGCRHILDIDEAERLGAQTPEQRRAEVIERRRKLAAGRTREQRLWGGPAPDLEDDAAWEPIEKACGL